MNVPTHHCFHCGQPVPAGPGFDTMIDGQSRPMCCPGCKAVAEAIVAAGLSHYYRHRTETPSTAAEPVPDVLKQLAVYDHPDVQKGFVRAGDGTIREASLILEGIVCAACVWLNEHHLRQLPGVVEVAINYTTRRARIRWDSRRLPLSEILRAVQAIGYHAYPFDPDRAQDVLDRERRNLLRRLAVAGAFGMQVMILAVALYAGAFSGMEPEFRRLFQGLSLLLTLPVLGYSAQPFFQAAWRDLRIRRVGMDVPVSLGILLAFAGSVWNMASGDGAVYFDSIAMFVFFLLTGRYFELAGRKKAAEVSETLIHVVPALALRIRDGHEDLVPVIELVPGDRIRVRPGETIAADGVVLDGASSVDESLLTGESLPRARQPGDPVTGGTINIEHPITVRVDRIGDDTVLSAIVRLLERAQTEKPEIAAIADRAARWFVAGVLLLAVAVAGFWWMHDPSRWIAITIAVLVVTCPCALALATPVAITTATGGLMRHGLVVTRGHALESLARADTVIFDKTGTLTTGQLRVVDIRTYGELDSGDCLRRAAALERHSEHPLAAAIRAAARPPEPVAFDVTNFPGAGLMGTIDGVALFLGQAAFVGSRAAISIEESVIGELHHHGHSVVFLARPGRLLAAFVVADEPRAGARELVNELETGGRKVKLLSGDHRAAVRRLAATTGIGNFEFSLTPQDKFNRVRDLARQGAVVAMVGDGVNDAAALQAAHVSIAMGTGTSLAAASADLLLLSGHLQVLAYAFRIARQTLSVIRQNVVWAVTYNLVALPLAAAGWVAPWMAAIGMSASSLIVVANALRLRNRRSIHPTPRKPG